MATRLHDLIIVGAGPMGLEMGLAAAEAGLDFVILERGVIAESLRRWGFVELFSPWQQNTTERGRALCTDDISGDAVMSGREFRERYWLPLAESSALAGKLSEHCNVLKIGRAGAFKNSMIGDPKRATLPFHVLIEQDGEERIVRANNVVDASGVYGNHRWLGSGGIPVPGERAADSKVSYELVDLLNEPGQWDGKTLMIVGAGYSACTALEQFRQIRQDGVDVSAHWVYLDESDAPLKVIDNDPLPYRRRLAELGNAMAVDPPDGLTVHAGNGIASLHLEANALTVVLRGDTNPIRCDQILATVGYSPDRSLSEELQFHECWATSGPMKLAASLLAQSAEAGGDCLAIDDTGPDTLKNPEPGFYVIGAKSYGRNPDFLIQRGHAQVEAVISFLRA